MNRPDFLITPSQVAFDPDLTPGDGKLYAILYWLERLVNQKCTASNETLAELCGFKANTIQEGLVRLEQKGYIRRFYLDKERKKRSEIKTLVAYSRVPATPGMVPGGAGTSVPAVAGQKEEEVKEEELKRTCAGPDGVKQIVNHFFELKGWANKGKEFYTENRIVYGRFTRSAKDLLELCEGDAAEANACLDKLAAWAKSRSLDWSIETVFKKWHDLDELKPKEKRPHYQGKRIFQKSDGGRWWVVSRDGEIRELGLIPKHEEIEWK